VVTGHIRLVPPSLNPLNPLPIIRTKGNRKEDKEERRRRRRRPVCVCV